MGDLYRQRGKRMLDIVGAAGALVVTSPVQVAAACAIRRQMGSPIVFRQQRPGRYGRPFTLLKLRTMLLATATTQGVEADALRLTSLGSWLRATSIDELPELWNVIRGDMSLVGPRPLLMEYLPRYTAEQARRHEVRPGITGWAQVNGRNALTWEQKFDLDVWYVDNYSFLLDVKIVWRTMATVFKRGGVTAEGHATAPEFRPAT